MFVSFFTLGQLNKKKKNNFFLLFLRGKKLYPTSANQIECRNM